MAGSGHSRAIPGLTASDVIERGAIDKVAVSRAVTKLDEKGLVKRIAQTEDRRRVALELTRKGIGTFNAVVPKALAYEEQLLDGLTTEEQATLGKLLEQLQLRAESLNESPEAG